MSDSLFSLNGKVSIVTGAAGLLGIQHCKALAQAGSFVVMTDIHRADVLEQKRQEHLPDFPLEQFFCISTDITKEDSIQALNDAVLARFKTIDVLVNNAAVNDAVENRTSEHGEPPGFETYPLEAWNTMLTVNLTGTFLCCKIIGRTMVKQGKGSIINIASTYGVVGPDQSLYIRPDGSRLMYKSPAYSATKGGVLAFTRFLAGYWGKKGVRVNALSPGGVENHQEEFFIKNYSAKTMLNRMASPNEYRGAIVFLASDASSYMTGANVIVDGGWTAW